MISSILSKLRSFKDVINYVKTASEAAVMRLFNARRTKYDDLLRRMDSFATVIHASGVTEVDVSGGPVGKGKAKLGEKTIRFKDGAALQVDTFKAPDRKKLAEDVKLFEEADQTIEELDAMLVRLSKKNDVATRKIVKEMKQYRDNLVQRTEELHDAIEKLTHKHLPAEMKTMMAGLFKSVNEVLPHDVYDELTQDVYITSHNSLTSKKNREPIEFTYYLHIEGLNADQFKSDELILALTGIVHEVREGRGKSKFYMTFHLNALTKFTPPGAFKEGRQLAGANTAAVIRSMGREAAKLISLHSSMPHVGRRKLTATRQQILHSGILDVDGIFDIHVEDDEIVIDIASMADDVIRDDLWPEIIVYLRKVLRAPRKSSFVYTVEKRGKNKVMRVSNVNSPTGA